MSSLFFCSSGWIFYENSLPLSVNERFIKDISSRERRAHPFGLVAVPMLSQRRGGVSGGVDEHDQLKAGRERGKES